MRKQLVAVGAAFLLSAGVLSACGSDGDDKASDSGTLRVTTLGLCSEIPVFWADEKGIFKENGVDVELVKSTGGAAALTALQSGDIDLAFTNPFSTMIATSQGIDLRWIATAQETTTVEGEGTNAIAVSTESGITDAKGLNGKTIGVNEIGGLNQIITSQWLIDQGADIESVKFVALPFNELASSVASKKIDGAQLSAQNVDPQLGLESLDDPYVAVGNGQPLVFAGYVATKKQSEIREATLKAFQDSLIAANKAIGEPANSEEKYQVQAQRCKQDAAYLKTLNEYIYEARVDTAALTRMGEILEGQDKVKNPVTPDVLVPSYIATK